MKTFRIVLFILGIACIGFGLFFLLGAVITFLEGSSEISSIVNLFMFIFLGILPFIGGIFICHVAAKIGRTTPQNNIQSDFAVPSSMPSRGAGFWIRALARIIDLVVHYMTTIIVAFIVGAILHRLSDHSFYEQLDKISWPDVVLLLLGYIAYYTVCEGFNGSTLGKLICGLIVVKENGSACNLGAAFGRSLAFIVDSLFFGLVGAFSMRTSPLRQRGGDKLLHTIVTRRRFLQPSQLRSGVNFTVVFLGAVIIDGIFIGFDYCLSLSGVF